MESDLLTKDASGRLLLKLVRDDAVEIIERLRETHADAMGRAYLIRLNLLADRLGAKWEGKCDLAFDNLKTSFERKFQEPNWCIKVDDESFLAVILTLGEHRGALSTAELWYSVGQFFVGDVSQMTPPLFEAIADDVDCMRLIPIDLSKYFDRAEARPFKQAEAPLPSAGPEAVIKAPISVGTMTQVRRAAIAGTSLSVAGWNLRVASAVEPVFEMKKLAMIGHRLEPVIVETSTNSALDSRSLASMDWGAREQIDLANIEQGIRLMQMRAPEQRKMVMMVPAAFSTFASARARSKLTPMVTAAAAEMGLKILFEVRNLNGVPSSRISEIVSLLKPYCMTTMGHVTAEARAISTLKGCGLAGICIDFDGAKRDDELLQTYLAPLCAAARATAGACMIQGLENLHQMAVARLAGVSHASIKASALMASRN